MNHHKILFSVIMCILLLSVIGNLLLAASLFKYKQKRSQVVTADELYSYKDFEQYANRYFENKLTSIFSKEELKYVASKQYHYSLSVNNQLVQNNTVNLKNTDKVRIVLSEIADESTSLPVEIQKTGSLIYGNPDTELTDFLGVYSSYEVTTTKKMDGANTIYYLDINQVEPRSMISLTIGDILLGNLNQEYKIQGNHIDICIQ